MKSETEMSAHCNERDFAEAPSADFINAISDLLNTDPSDLLVELGYYDRQSPVTTSEGIVAQN